MLKLNIGAGRSHLADFVPIDRKLGTEAYPLPDVVEWEGNRHAIAEDSVEEIRASHILEHFPEDETFHVLTEWVRVLKPGGVIRLSVPDIDKAVQMKDDPMWNRYIIGGQTDPDDFHKAIFNESTLRTLMDRVGLVGVESWTSDNTDTASHAVSCNLLGTKPEGWKPNPAFEKAPGLPSARITACAVMSLPRVGFNATWGCIADAFAPYGIPVDRFTGAFWGQCMENVLTRRLEKNTDWIICLDYDSLFTPKQLDIMLRIFGSSPHIDALSCIQTRRNHTNPLMTIQTDAAPGSDFKIEINGSPIKARTAHFGLTFLRAEALRKMPHPWFQHVPGPDGTWTHPEHIDDDIWFWKQWEKHGNSLYVTPLVRIGHIEERISYFDDDFEPTHARMSEWRHMHGMAKEESIA